MTKTERNWTGNIHLGAKVDIEVVLNQLVHAFNTSFFKHNGMTMRVVDGQIEAYVEMQDFMIGNVAFQILHGGLAATILDSIGGIVAMVSCTRKLNRKLLPIRLKGITSGDGRYARGLSGARSWQIFIARAETLRLGRKGCTMRMTMVNDDDKPIATAIASYAY